MSVEYRIDTYQLLVQFVSDESVKDFANALNRARVRFGNHVLMLC